MKRMISLLLIVIPLSAQQLTITQNDGTAFQGQLVGITEEQMVIQRSSGQTEIIKKSDIATIVDNTAGGTVATAKYKQMTSLVSIPSAQPQRIAPEQPPPTTPQGYIAVPTQPYGYPASQPDYERVLDQIERNTRNTTTIMSISFVIELLSIIWLISII